MKNKKYAVIFAVAICMSIGILGWMWWNDSNTPPLPMPSAMKTPKASKEKPVPTAGQAHKEEEAKVPATPTVPTAGNVGQLTELQAQIREEKLRVELEELRKKKKQLTASNTPAQGIQLPDLPVRTPQSVPLSLPQATAPASRSPRVAVVSIQGVDANLTATIRTSNGHMVTLRQGQAFGGGRIVEVSRAGVKLQSGKIINTLPFE